MSTDTLTTTVTSLWTNFHSGHTKSYEWRLSNLRKFRAMLSDNMGLIAATLMSDLHQSDPTPHIFVCLREVEFMIDNLRSLMSSRSKTSDVSFVNFPASAEIVPEPVGPVLVLGTWNYPYHSSLGAVPGALAAGNPVLVKPGFLAQASSHAMKALIEKHFDSSDVACVEGDVEVVTALINDFNWGHIFFTGGTRIGEVIAAAAARQLIPVTLELGGKNPTIIEKSADIKLAARRVAWGKWASNAGQVCIAPDHLLVDETVADEFLGELKSCLKKFFGEPSDLGKCPDYCRIVSDYHAMRLETIIQQDQDKTFHVHGEHDIGTRLVAPTIFDFGTDFETFKNSAAMKEEIFGPILPVVRFTDRLQCERFVAEQARQAAPLALYVFTSDNAKSVRRRILDKVPSGAVVINDTGIHIVEGALPFGGTGVSGLGQYHGERTFEKFSHFRPVLWKSGWLDIPFRYPPFGERSVRIVKIVMWLSAKRITPVRVGKFVLVLALLYKVLKK